MVPLKGIFALVEDFVLSVKDLKKTYGKFEALKGISFNVKKGECFGLLGPNGAGKSTTLEIIEQVIKPSSGEVLYFGRPLNKSTTDELGVQFQNTALLPSLTVMESIETFSGFYSNARSVEKLVELCDLGEFKNKRHEKLSGGQRQRLLLAIALSNNPKLLLLDEPTTGLDPQARRNLWDTIIDIKKQGTTIILTTHYMDEAQILCDNLVIVDHGEILAEGQPSKLIKNHLPQVVVELSKKANLSLKDRIEKYDDFQELEDTFSISTKNLSLLMREILEANLDISELNVRQPNLEDLFIKLTGKKLRE